MQSIRSRHIGCSTATVDLQECLEHVRMCKFSVRVLYKCLTIRAYACAWMCVAKCENLALFSKAFHTQITNDDLFEFSKGFASLPIPSGLC